MLMSQRPMMPPMSSSGPTSSWYGSPGMGPPGGQPMNPGLAGIVVGFPPAAWDRVPAWSSQDPLLLGMTPPATVTNAGHGGQA
jgi:hypothetical protein